MELDERIAALEALFAKRKEIEAQILAVMGGQALEKKERACGKCGKPGHIARNCPEAVEQVVS